MRNGLMLAFAASILTVSTASYAATQCRDAHGKLIKCPEKKAAPAQKCKDAKGKFAKCGTPGARPV